MVEEDTEIDKDEERIEDKIERILERHDSLTATSILLFLQARVNERVTKKRVYRKLNRMRKWGRVQIATRRPVSFYKVVQDE